MVSEKLQQKLNEQITHELGAEMQYLAMSFWFEQENLPGMAKWFLAQAAEEHEHAMKIVGLLGEWDLPITLISPPSPIAIFKNAESVFEAALGQERVVTAQITDIFSMARDEKSWQVEIAFQWFVTEQVEEEVNARDNLARIRLVGDNPAALLEFDRHLSA
jgi:ferritin|tara:strand:+ start:242 stop:724 length:483 start_codon:yes stop_codon:yes gene_type:complete